MRRKLLRMNAKARKGLALFHGCKACPVWNSHICPGNQLTLYFCWGLEGEGNLLSGKRQSTHCQQNQGIII